ncbi:hypothetical protein [Stutzerimonas stutzeri]|uniref:hypothetical protein n=1 Tax=Stutzerimonas stutzeri TaxID=316 RepID=UPI001C2DF341|nr:hypothetical protein [Stutzerimonas stutzeri]
MPVWKIAVWGVFAALALAGCNADDPQAALDAAAESLQQSIEKRDTGALMDSLHTDFTANGQYGRDWAQRTATLMFLRHRNVNVIRLSSRSWINPTYPDRGHSQAQVALTGAEHLLPQRARHYEVRLEWWKEHGQWKLARLDWQ